MRNHEIPWFPVEMDNLSMVSYGETGGSYGIPMVPIGYNKYPDGTTLEPVGNHEIPWFPVEMDNLTMVTHGKTGGPYGITMGSHCSKWKLTTSAVQIS